MGPSTKVGLTPHYGTPSCLPWKATTEQICNQRQTSCAQSWSTKAESSFVPKAGEKLSRRGIEARIGVFTNSIDAVIGTQRHADQSRTFSRDFKVIKHAALHHIADVCCLPSSQKILHQLVKIATLAGTSCKEALGGAMTTCACNCRKACFMPTHDAQYAGSRFYGWVMRM